MPSFPCIKLCVATLFIAFAAAAAQAAEPVWQLVIKCVPTAELATNTAKAVPATQPSYLRPALTAHISFIPDTPISTDFQMNNKTFHLSALVSEQRSGRFHIKIDVGTTEHTEIASESHETATAPATQKSPTLEELARSMQTTDDIKAVTYTTSIESVSTTASLREGEEHSLGGSGTSQWLIKIEKKPAQK